MLNWVYCDKATYELKYSNRSGSIEHIVGEWDWTQDERMMLFDGWEGFVAIDEWDGADEDESTPWGREGLRWALYFDLEDNGLKNRRKGRDMFEVALERKIQSAEDQLKQLEEAEKKMQVKSRGGLSTQFSAPAKGGLRSGRRSLEKARDVKAMCLHDMNRKCLYRSRKSSTRWASTSHRLWIKRQKQWKGHTDSIL